VYLIVSVAMAILCPACGRRFSESRGLGTHKRYCKDLQGLVTWAKQHHDDEAASRSPKRVRNHSYGLERSVDPEDDMLVDEHASGLGDDAALDLELPPEPQAPVSVSFSGRKRKVPQTLKDYLPHSLAGLPSHLHPPPPISMQPTVITAASPLPPSDPAPEADVLRTHSNGFGLHREYMRKPRIDPDEDITSQRTRNAPNYDSGPFFHPLPNATVFRLLNWFYRASATKSMADVDCLVHEVILAEDFNLGDLQSFSMAQEMARLDEYGTTNSPFSAEDGWKEGSVKIRIPNTKSKHTSENTAPEFQVSGIYYRPLLEVIRSAFQRPDVQGSHWVPFKWFHQSSEGQQRVYSDIYNSDAMLEEDAKIHALPRNPEDEPNIEVAMGAILLWSDSTHLTSFGSASLWPIYLFFGNLSKYTRGKPNAHVAHHLAYVPSVSMHSVLTYSTLS
jgi:hypothetical protein